MAFAAPAVSNIPSTANSTTTPLAAGAEFVGGTENVLAYQESHINVFANPRSAAGTLYFEFSPNGVNWDVSVPLDVPDPNVFVPYPLSPVLQFFRVRYVNGSVAQTEFRLSTLHHASVAALLTRTPTQTVGAAEPIKVVRAVVEPSFVGEYGILGAERAVFGAAVTGQRIQQLETDFVHPLANNRVTTTVSGGGATAQANGQATISTGTGTTASARLETSRVARYRPGSETYAIFTARFTTPTHAGSHQRSGLFDASNGFFLGFNGLNFGFTVRSAAVDTFTPLTSANGDSLNKTFLSRFTRNGLLEAITHTNLNVWRIRFGWLGSSVCHFECQAPDGAWLRVHTLTFPSSQTTPSIQNTSLPIAMEARKTSADATNLVIGTGSWAAGFVADSFGLEPYDVRAREEELASLTLTGSAIPQTATIYTVNPGRILRVTDMLLAMSNDLTGAMKEVTLTDGAGGAVKMRTVCPQATALTQGFVSLHPSWRCPPGFLTSVFMNMPALGPNGGASITIYGYEDTEV